MATVLLGTIVQATEIGKERGRFIRVMCPLKTEPNCAGERWVFYRKYVSTQRMCGPCNRRRARREFNLQTVA